MLTAAAQTPPVEATFPGAANTGFPMIDTFCSDVLIFANDPTSHQAEVFLVNDFSATSDVALVANALGGAAGIAALPAVALGSFQEPANVDSEVFEVLTTIPVHSQSGATSSVVVRLRDLPDFAPPALCNNATVSISDQLQVAPAAPPIALFGLAIILAGSGMMFIRRRGAKAFTA
jgi:hypothetical protein